MIRGMNEQTKFNLFIKGIAGGGGGGALCLVPMGLCRSEATQPLPNFKGNFCGKGYLLSGGGAGLSTKQMCTLATQLASSLNSKISKPYPNVKDTMSLLQPTSYMYLMGVFFGEKVTH